MRLETIEQVAGKSSQMCSEINCHNLGAIHFNPQSGLYTCRVCMAKAENSSKLKFYRPKVKCKNCSTGIIKFLEPHAGSCDECHKRVEVPSHQELVRTQTKERAQAIMNDIENLFAQYDRKPQTWALISNIAYRLKTEADKL